jgi:hypothetical protein
MPYAIWLGVGVGVGVGVGFGLTGVVMFILLRKRSCFNWTIHSAGQIAARNWCAVMAAPPQFSLSAGH